MCDYVPKSSVLVANKWVAMVPVARIIELTRSQVQVLLDGGFQILILPNVKDADEAKRFVELGKYPPVGKHGLSSCSAGTNYSLGSDPLQTLSKTNQATHHMVQFEDNEGLSHLDSVPVVRGIAMVTVGPLDWKISLGMSATKAERELAPRIANVLQAAQQAGRITAALATNFAQTTKYKNLGARILFAGIDISIKREALYAHLARLQSTRV